MNFLFKILKTQKLGRNGFNRAGALPASHPVADRWGPGHISVHVCADVAHGRFDRSGAKTGARHAVITDGGTDGDGS